MKALFRMAACDHLQEEKYNPDFLSAEKAEKVRAFHYAFPMCQPIPWQIFANDSAAGMKDIYAKDGSRILFQHEGRCRPGKLPRRCMGWKVSRPALKGSHYKKPCAETAHGFLLAGNQSFRIDWA
ncbi:MAG: hypothetical protein IJP04_04490 [Clostridia bacterium]|nr:hypothetical protein [Clostridia bacterium]